MGGKEVGGGVGERDGERRKTEREGHTPNSDAKTGTGDKAIC